MTLTGFLFRILVRLSQEKAVMLQENILKEAHQRIIQSAMPN